MATAQVTPLRLDTKAEDQSATTLFESFYWLPCQASAEIAVPGFTVGDLLKLTSGSIVQTITPSTKDVPLHINRILLGSGQFEVIGERLAVRITEFA